MSAPTPDIQVLFGFCHGYLNRTPHVSRTRRIHSTERHAQRPQHRTLIHQQTDRMIYELRIYTTLPGRMPNLLARFENHTLRIWEKHGIKQVGFW